MTIRIPLRLVLFILYTAAVLGGAFGISYAVFEWREDDGGSDSGLTLESLDARIDDLDGRIDSVTKQVSGLRSASGSNDSTSCHATVKAMIFAAIEALAFQAVAPSLEREARELDADFSRYC